MPADKTHECSSPPIVHHAHHTGSGGGRSFELGTNIRYQCDAGYTPRKDSVDRAWCVGGGIWVGPNMTCVSEYPVPVATGQWVLWGVLSGFFFFFFFLFITFI